MKKPNILIVHCDQLRYDCISPNFPQNYPENARVITPNIDKLASDGINYTNCFTTFPICTPARYSFITGMYVHQHLGWSNHCTIPRAFARDMAFPSLLKENGYNTACVGKMHYTPTYLDVGFDKMILAEQDGPGRYDDDYHAELIQKGKIDYIDARDQIYTYRQKAPREYFDNFGTDPSNLPDELYSTDWIAEKAMQELKQWGSDRPNLLMVGFIKPHHPFDVPDKWSNLYNEDKLIPLPGWSDAVSSIDNKYAKGFFNYNLIDNAKLKKVMKKYFGSITHIDHYVGEFIKLLKERGIYDNTLIIFTADHGEYMGFHHLLLKGNYMYDPLIKVPLVVKYPEGSEGYEIGTNEKRREIKSFVSIIDIYATILEEADVMIPQALWENVIPLPLDTRETSNQDGIDGTDEDELRKLIFAESGGGNYMVRDHNYKLLLCKSKTSQFFDLKKDPHEFTNLYNEPEYSGLIAQYKEELLKWLAFKSTSLDHLDEFAPCSGGKQFNPSERAAIKKKYEKLMKDFKISL